MMGTLREAENVSRSSLRIDPEFQSLVPPLSGEERRGLEQTILAEGVRDPIVVWGDVIVDGHNRYEIARGHNPAGRVLEFEVVQRDFPNRAAAREWIVKNQLDRHNLTREQSSYYRGQSYISAEKRQGERRDPKTSGHFDQRSNGGEAETTAERLARENGVGERTVRRDAEYAQAVDRLAENFGPEFRSELLEGQSKLTRTDTYNLSLLAREDPETARLTAALLMNEATTERGLAHLQARVLFECGWHTWENLWEHDDDDAKVRHSTPQLEHLLKLADLGSADEVTAHLVELAETDAARSVVEAHQVRREERRGAVQESRRATPRSGHEAAPMPERRYEVLLADPLREYSFTETESRRVENHYPTMTLDEIKAVEIPAENDAVLFLWATSPNLPEALEVMEA